MSRVSESRTRILVAYKQAGEALPLSPQCPKCGLPVYEGERHHLAGRRKDAFLFTAMVHKTCHDWIHSNGKKAEAIGLLMPCRNSKVITLAAATELVLKQRFPAMYSLDILKHFSLTKRHGTTKLL